MKYVLKSALNSNNYSFDNVEDLTKLLIENGHSIDDQIYVEMPKQEQDAIFQQVNLHNIAEAWEYARLTVLINRERDHYHDMLRAKTATQKKLFKAHGDLEHYQRRLLKGISTPAGTIMIQERVLELLHEYESVKESLDNIERSCYKLAQKLDGLLVERNKLKSLGCVVSNMLNSEHNLVG